MSSPLRDHLGGYFPVLYLHRDDVALAVALYGPDEFSDEDDDPTPEADEFAAALTDEDVEYLAKKLGDDLMSGGSYYGSLCERAIDQHYPGVAS